jgi:predicted ferric reductase
MTPEQLFSLVNLVAMAGWLLLAVLPDRRWTTSVVSAVVVPALLAVVYTTIVAVRWGGADGGFGSLDAVSRLFADPWVLLAGWVHYLAFDLFVGSWEVRDARSRGIPHWLVLPCLFFTFMFGPAGWLLYMGTRAVRRRALTVS